MKQINSIKVLVMSLVFGFFTLNCQHDDEEVIPIIGPDPIAHGTETFNCTDCTPLVSNGASADFSSSDVAPEVWYFDKAHSNVMWESQYKAFGSLLTGRFNYFVVEDLVFDEADPADLSFNGYVWLNSVNTGEPGRDGGCLLGTFATDAARTTEADNIASLVSVAGSGRYSSIDESFLVDANFTFLGVTKKVTVKLTYYPESDQETYVMRGLTAQFEFFAISDFAVGSTNIADKVLVTMNILFKNKKP